MKKKISKKWFMRIGCALGWFICVASYLLITTLNAKANTPVNLSLPFITPSMLVATIIGAFGSYLAFGKDKKFPPTSASIGHILLGFGAGLFFTRGSLELMGHIDSSDNVVIFVSFLWACAGYFILRLVVSVVNSDELASILPDWVARLLGVDKK